MTVGEPYSIFVAPILDLSTPAHIVLTAPFSMTEPSSDMLTTIEGEVSHVHGGKVTFSEIHTWAHQPAVAMLDCPATLAALAEKLADIVQADKVDTNLHVVLPRDMPYQHQLPLRGQVHTVQWWKCGNYCEKMVHSFSLAGETKT